MCIRDSHNPDASLMKIIKQLCAEAQVKQLAFERNHLSYLLFENLQQALAGTAALIPTGELAESLRYTKSPEEITLMRQACANTDKALQQICQYIRPGVSEKDIARELLYAIPVSYTHLDVYKRQVLHKGLPLQYNIKLTVGAGLSSKWRRKL